MGLRERSGGISMLTWIASCGKRRSTATGHDQGERRRILKLSNRREKIQRTYQPGRGVEKRRKSLIRGVCSSRCALLQGMRHTKSGLAWPPNQVTARVPDPFLSSSFRLSTHHVESGSLPLYNPRTTCLLGLAVVELFNLMITMLSMSKQQTQNQSILSNGSPDIHHLRIF